MSRSIWPQRLSHCSKLHVGAQQIYRKILFVNSCELVLSTECFGMILQVLADSQELEPKWFSRAATCGWGAICKVDGYDTNLRKWHQVFTDVFKDSCHLELEVYIYIYLYTVYYIWLKFKVEQWSISNVNIQSSLAVAAFGYWYHLILMKFWSWKPPKGFEDTWYVDGNQKSGVHSAVDMVNIPLFTRVSYKSGGFLAGISGCHQQDGSWFYIFSGKDHISRIRVGTFLSR